jgi:hypothetical protein
MAERVSRIRDAGNAHTVPTWVPTLDSSSGGNNTRE